MSFQKIRLREVVPGIGIPPDAPPNPENLRCWIRFIDYYDEGLNTYEYFIWVENPNGIRFATLTDNSTRLGYNTTGKIYAYRRMYQITSTWTHIHAGTYFTGYVIGSDSCNVSTIEANFPVYDEYNMQGNLIYSPSGIIFQFKPVRLRKAIPYTPNPLGILPPMDATYKYFAIYYRTDVPRWEAVVFNEKNVTFEEYVVAAPDGRFTRKSETIRGKVYRWQESTNEWGYLRTYFDATDTGFGSSYNLVSNFILYDTFDNHIWYNPIILKPVILAGRITT